MQITGNWGKVTVFNIYNDGESDEMIRLLTEYHCRNKNNLKQAVMGKAHIIWLGDFNSHHPY